MSEKVGVGMCTGITIRHDKDMIRVGMSRGLVPERNVIRRG
jgi:hypothetical protein